MVAPDEGEMLLGCGAVPTTLLAEPNARAASSKDLITGLCLIFLPQEELEEVVPKQQVQAPGKRKLRRNFPPCGTNGSPVVRCSTKESARSCMSCLPTTEGY